MINKTTKSSNLHLIGEADFSFFQSFLYFFLICRMKNQYNKNIHKFASSQDAPVLQQTLFKVKSDHAGYSMSYSLCINNINKPVENSHKNN